VGWLSSRQRCLSLLLHLLGSKLCLITFFFEDPVILAVIFVTTSLQKLTEEATHIVVVRAFVEIQIFAILQVLRELFWARTSQLLNSCLNLLLLDTIILVIFVLAGKTLPR